MEMKSPIEERRSGERKLFSESGQGKLFREEKLSSEMKRDHLRQGQWVEALFVARATAEGLNVSKPWGAYRYDFVVEHAGRTSRVQVKSCSYRRGKGYNCLYQAPRRRPYTADEFDFLAVYIVPEELWYVLPVAAIAATRSIIVLSPAVSRSKYHRYREAWPLLRASGED